MRGWTSPLENVCTSTVGSGWASVRLLWSYEIMPANTGKFVVANVWPGRVPVRNVPVSGPFNSLVNVRSGATLYVNDAWKLFEVAPQLWKGLSEWVTLTERPCRVPVPSPLKVRTPCTLNEKTNRPPIGIRSLVNPPSPARQVASPVKA